MNFVLVGAQFVFIVVFAVLAIGDITGEVEVKSFTAPFVSSGMDVGAIFAGAAILALSFLGFDAVSTLSEETDDPRSRIPKAILLCALAGGLVYIFQSYLGQLAFPDYAVVRGPPGRRERRRHEVDRRRLPQLVLHRRLRRGRASPARWPARRASRGSCSR